MLAPAAFDFLAMLVGGRIVLPTGNYMEHATSGEILIYHLPGR